MSSHHSRIALRWIPAVLWMALVFILSSMPIDDISDNEWIATITRKGGHVAVFGTLALFIWWALPDSRPRPWLAFFLTALYGISDEFHQSFVPPRVGSPFDALIDAIGAALAILTITWYQRRIQRKSGNTSLPKAAMLSRWAATSDSQK